MLHKLRKRKISLVPYNIMYVTMTCRVIRLSSPNLNYILILGVCLVYLTGIVFVIPTNDPMVLPGLCMVSSIKFHIL